MVGSDIRWRPTLGATLIWNPTSIGQFPLISHRKVPSLVGTRTMPPAFADRGSVFLSPRTPSLSRSDIDQLVPVWPVRVPDDADDLAPRTHWPKRYPATEVRTRQSRSLEPGACGPSALGTIEFGRTLPRGTSTKGRRAFEDYPPKSLRLYRVLGQTDLPDVSF